MRTFYSGHEKHDLCAIFIDVTLFVCRVDKDWWKTLVLSQVSMCKSISHILSCTLNYCTSLNTSSHLNELLFQCLRSTNLWYRSMGKCSHFVPDFPLSSVKNTMRWNYKPIVTSSILPQVVFFGFRLPCPSYVLYMLHIYIRCTYNSFV